MSTENNSLKTLCVEHLTDGRIAVSQRELQECLAGSTNALVAINLWPTKTNNLTTSAPLYSPTSDSPRGTTISNGSTLEQLAGLYCAPPATPEKPKPSEPSAPSSEGPRKPQAYKLNAGKAPMDLLSGIALKACAMVLAFGAKKYAANAWRVGLKHEEVAAAILRHLLAYLDGEDLDPESGLPHVDHVLCEAMFLSELIRTRPDLDGRFKREAK